MPYNKTKKNLQHYTLIGFILIIIGSFNIIDVDIVTNSIINGLGIMFVGLYIAFYADKHFDLFSPAFFIGISLTVFYGLGTIVPFLYSGGGYFSRQLLPLLPYYPQASLIVFLSSIFFLIGYTTNIRQLNGEKNNLFSWKIYGKKLKFLWLFFISLGFIAFLLLIRYGVFLQTTTKLQTPLFYSMIGFIQPGLIFSLALSFTAMIMYKKNFWKIAFFLNFVIFLIFGLPSGSKTLFLLPIIIVALSYNYSKKLFTKQQAVTGILTLLLFLSLLMPFNSYYRTLQLSSNNTGQSLEDSFDIMVSTVETMEEKGFKEVFELSMDYMAARLSNISVTAKILQYHESPSSIIHLGSSYFRLFYMFIPRFIYPDKPAITIGRIIAVELGYTQATGILLGEKAASLSIGITTVGELVYNFSILAPLGMFFFGLLFRWLYNIFLHSKKVSPISAIPMYTIVWYMVIFRGGESNFAAVFSGLIKYIIFLILIFFILKIKQDRLSVR